MDALVTDLNLRNAVAGLRGLGRDRIRVIGVGSARLSPGMRSRYTRVRALAPHVLDDPAALAACVDALADEHGPLVAYPGREETIDALYVDRSPRSARVVSPYPGREPLARLRDKRTLAALGEDVGLPSPRVLLEATAGELAALPRLPVPCAVKPADAGNRNTLSSTHLFDDEEAMRAALAALAPCEPLIVQERADGALISVGLVVARDGALAARFQHRAWHTWPPRAGSTARAVSVEPDRDLVESAAQLLRDAGYWGLAEIELLETARGLRLIDVNPRYYGCLALPLACGVNLPAIWHAVVEDRAVPAPAPYRVGVHFRWLEADVSAALKGAPGKLLGPPPRPRVGPFWARDDAAPAALLAADAVATRARRVFGRSG